METFILHFIIRIYKSLNRTMQYGNQENKKKKMNMSDGLNRTMQYGNRHSVCFPLEGKQFKSYYVVWKQIVRK